MIWIILRQVMIMTILAVVGYILYNTKKSGMKAVGASEIY